MRWFVLLGVVMALYCYFLLSTATMMVNSTQQLHYQYQSAAAYADQIAAGGHVSAGR